MLGAKKIKALNHKKYRRKYNLFIAESPKVVEEVLQSDIKIVTIFALDEWLHVHRQIIEKNNIEIVQADEQMLKKLSNLPSPNQVIAVCEMPRHALKDERITSYTIALDDIQDPGNLGTIIRIADWFGIDCIICSESCVDVYNPKVIQSTMGSFVRVKVFYEALAGFLKQANMPVYGATLSGKNLHQVAFDKSGIILIGNESKGISENLKQYVSEFISIPAYGKAESLNAAIATGIICDNVRRFSEKTG